MVKKTVTIKNVTGLTLKPAEHLSKVALRYKSHTGFEYKDGSANAKSILSILASGVRQGEEITLICSGKDENEAMDALIQAIEEGLGE
ncbi:MAG: HPr family phosphocarrier protein [Lachnospiraceae bacterium]|nr:HPr family phosphocarrier protein [Lachnospiraceae bacterium]